MRLIFTNTEDRLFVPEYFKRRGTVEVIPLDNLFEQIVSSRLGLLYEAVVCFGVGQFDSSSIETVASKLRALPCSYAMADGRTWNQLPIIMASSSLGRNHNEQLSRLQITHIDFNWSMDRLFDQIRSVISDYWNRVLDELADMNFEVKEDHGRYRIGRPSVPLENLIGAYYYGPADTLTSKSGVTTIKRLAAGIQYEFELFDALLRDPNIKEPDLHLFFEDHPHFLEGVKRCEPLSHIRLQQSSGEYLIPDFILRPTVAPQRDSNWEVLELKRPQAKLLSKPRKNQVRFSAAVASAIDQVKNYAECLRNPANEKELLLALGHRLRYPQLSLLMGRMPKATDIEALELAQSREPLVRVRTYDEIMEFQKNLIE